MKCSGGYYVIPQHLNNLLFSGHSIEKYIVLNYDYLKKLNYFYKPNKKKEFLSPLKLEKNIIKLYNMLLGCKIFCNIYIF
jgi:hypothetical protein